MGAKRKLQPEPTVYLPNNQELKKRKYEEIEEKEWSQDIHADCIPIAGREDIQVVLVMRGDTVLHTAVVPTFEDMDPIGVGLEDLRPMPYGRYRTSAEGLVHTEKVDTLVSKDTPGN